jgi:GxxExxY protein
MDENAIAKAVVDAAYNVHKELGPGLLESVYESGLCYELDSREIKYNRQHPIRARYKGKILEDAFRADILVEEKVILELKSLETVSPVHKKQLITYLKLSNCKLGLLINFGSILIKDGITRVVNRL